MHIDKHKIMRARKAKSRQLRELAAKQAFNSSIWATVSYRHGNESQFKSHGKYYVAKPGGADDE